jgi:pyruvate dehydrogenase E1 component beta subunit
MRQMTGGNLTCLLFSWTNSFWQDIRATHQALENWFANTPGLKVVVPSPAYDAKGY